MQSSGPFCAVYIVDLFVHSSGPFGGPFSDGGGGGGSSEPREPPLATALEIYSFHM